MIPAIIVLRALSPVPDQEIAAALAMGDNENTFLTDRIEVLLRMCRQYKLTTRESCLAFLGERFRSVFQCPPDWSRRKIGLFLIERILLVHLPDHKDKFRMMWCARLLPPAAYRYDEERTAT